MNDAAPAARCPECQETVAPEDARCAACGAPVVAEPGDAPAPEVPKREEDLDEPAVPGLKERALSVLTAPNVAFRRHHAGWGWAGPWVLVAAIGVLAGLVTLARVDLEAIARHEMERGIPPAQQKQLEENPEAAEAVKTWSRFMVFFTKTWTVVGPVLGTLVGVVMAGLFLFAGCLTLAREAGPPDLMRCISVAAHASLVNAVGYGVTGLAVLLGNPTPTTSPAHLVDPHQAAVLAVFLGRLDPIVVWYYVLIAAGLAHSCRMSRGRAWGLTAAVYLGSLVLLVGMTAASKAVGGGA